MEPRPTAGCAHLAETAHIDETVESVARVVAIENGVPWLEPEQVSRGCSGCLSLAACSAKAGGSSMETRRFPLSDGPMSDGPALRVGERVVVSLPEKALLRAAATAYGLPLVTMLGAGITAQGVGGGDGVCAAACLIGLAFGLGLARLAARRLTARGELTPRYVRRADVF